MTEVIPADEVRPVPTEGQVPSRVPFRPSPKVIPGDEASPVSKLAEQPKLNPSTGRTMVLGHENQLLGAAQHTSPHPDEHKDRFLGEAMKDETDTLGYHDQEGKFQPTDRNKHVVLRDMENGKYKVFERHKDTDLGPIEGRLGGMGQLVMQGMGGSMMPYRGASAADMIGRGGLAGKLGISKEPIVMNPLASHNSEAGQAMRTADAVQDATGVNVAVPRTAVTESRARETAARMTAALPGGSAPFAKATGNMAGGLEQAVDAAAEMPTGARATAESAGEAARTGITETIKPKGILADRVTKAYDAVDTHMPGGVTHDIRNTRAVGQTILNEHEAAKLTEGGRKLPDAVKRVADAITDPQGLTYGGLKKLRSYIGAEMEAASGAEKTDLKRLYRGLSDDMRGMVQQHGGSRALQLWERANTYAAKVADRREVLEKMLGTKGDEGIFAKIVSMAGDTSTANAKLLATTRKSIGSRDWGEVASGVISRMGRTNTAEGHVFSPEKFVKDYNKLSDRGKSILFGDNTKHRETLDQIVQLSERWPRSARLAEPAGDVVHAAASVSIFHAPLHALKIFLGSNTLGKILSRPNSAAYALKFTQKAEQLRLRPTPANLVAYNNATRTLVTEAAGDETRHKVEGPILNATGKGLAGILGFGAALYYGAKHHLGGNHGE